MTPEELRAARERLGLTQTQLARLLGLPAVKTYQRYEAGERVRRTGGDVPGPVAAYVRALLAGYRPPD